MKFIKLKKLLEKEINFFISTGIEWIPIIFIEVNQNEKDEIVNFLENIEDDDDVQNVYSNVKFKELNVYNWNRSWNIRSNLFF